MLSIDERLAVAETLSERGDHAAALAKLHKLSAGLHPAESSQLHLVRAAILARADRMQEALEVLRLSEALANAGSRVDVVLEVEVTRASIHAALGDYGVAIPLLTRAIASLEAHPELHALRTDAVAELACYQNLMSTRR